MQWAIRSNQPRNTTSTGLASGHSVTTSGFIYVDSSTIRRSAAGNGAAASTTANELNSSSSNERMGNASSALARAFGIVVREVRYGLRVDLSRLLVIQVYLADPVVFYWNEIESRDSTALLLGFFSRKLCLRKRTLSL